MELGVRREEELCDPAHSRLAVAAASMRAGNSQIELGRAVTDVGEIDQSDQADGLAIVDDPMTGHVRTRNVHLVDIGL